MNRGFLSNSDESHQKTYYPAGSASQSKTRSVEEKIFGKSFNRTNKYHTEGMTKGVLLVSCVIVLTSGIIFGLGVLVIIKYRTLPVEFNAKMGANASVIVFCFMMIFYLHKLNLRLYKYVCKNSTGTYSRLVNMDFINIPDDASIELQEGIKRTD